MTQFRLGYVAMSVHVQNASPSQTMTFKQFSSLNDRQAAIRKLERIAQSNLSNTLRLLKHSVASGVTFFRMSSRLVPLATHENLSDWNYIQPIKEDLQAIGTFAKEKEMRIDFHPDHFVVLNSPDKDTFKFSLQVLKYHYRLLHGMGIDPTHRCVLHLGGAYQNKEKALEQFIENWAYVPSGIQKMIMLENDDKVFTMEDCLYVCEKLNIPFIFDLHHHMANHYASDWIIHWDRVVATWEHSPLPLKMHISSPKSTEDFKSHADLIDYEMFKSFLQHVSGSVQKVDCMIEAKLKDEALFTLSHQLHEDSSITMETPSLFTLKGY
ncbi:UV DNA damage repair endonuclease UvsE [Pontibacillus salipaludis]|uniref:UV DNA damage repair endonuclease UvsE n=1 Tax=Pontibacillus salipaludis TaxID=1697394 RepID=UPI0031F18FA9